MDTQNAQAQQGHENTHRIGNTIDGAPVISVEALAELPAASRDPLIASVAGAEARGLIRAALARMGFVEIRDYVCAA